MPKNKIDLEKLTKAILAGGILLIGISLFYYLIIFIPHQQLTKEQDQIEDKRVEIRERCITQTIEEMKKAHPVMETPEITRFRVANDRGCFLEAGCMGNVQNDENFKPLFQSCNNDYYRECYSKIKAEAEKRVEDEKQKRISGCIELYQQ